jgi:PIN domain nuclease of toxin-antitoxin system
MSAVLLDTHVAIWLLEGSDRLGRRALRSIEKALSSDRLLVSAISFWEAALLRAKGRLRLLVSTEAWRANALAKGIVEVPVSGTIGIAAVELAHFHADPADRIIVATAIEQNAVLMTADQIIIDLQGPLHCHDAAR